MEAIKAFIAARSRDQAPELHDPDHAEVEKKLNKIGI